MESTSGNAHTDMVSLWYEFLRDFFLQNLFTKLTLQWFLFGMGSYKIMWYSLCVKCCNAHTDEVSFWNVIFNA